MNAHTEHYIPAIAPNAVFANGRHRMLVDYIRVAQAVDPHSDSPVEVLAAIDELYEHIEVQIVRHTERFRKIIPPNFHERVHDMDNVRMRPDDVAASPYGWWILGAINAMSAAQSAILLARIAARPAAETHAQLMSLLDTHRAQAERAWLAEVEVMNQTSPWLNARIESVDLVDITSDAPRFKVTAARSA
jgi:hypothetical protein